MSATSNHIPIDPHEQLTEQVHALANTAREICPEAAVVLFALHSALLSGHTLNFALHTEAWSVQQLARLEAIIKGAQS